MDLNGQARTIAAYRAHNQIEAALAQEQRHPRKKRFGRKRFGRKR